MGKINTIIVESCPDRGAGNDPDASLVALHQGLTLINAYCQGATNLVDMYVGMGEMQTIGRLP